jgi:chromate transporter
MLAVAQSVPGAIGANLAAYVGLRYAGIAGGYIAAISLTAPSIIIIIFIARMLQTFKESMAVKSVFSGLRPAAAGLLSAAAFGAISLSLWNSASSQWHEYLRWKETLIFAVILFLIMKLKKHPFIYIVAAGAIGVILKL